MPPKKKIFFVQLVMLSPPSEESTSLAATVVKLLEVAGHEPSLINVEHVTSRERYDEIERRMKAIKAADETKGEETKH